MKLVPLKEQESCFLVRVQKEKTGALLEALKGAAELTTHEFAAYDAVTTGQIKEAVFDACIQNFEGLLSVKRILK